MWSTGSVSGGQDTVLAVPWLADLLKSYTRQRYWSFFLLRLLICFLRRLLLQLQYYIFAYLFHEVLNVRVTFTVKLCCVETPSFLYSPSLSNTIILLKQHLVPSVASTFAVLNISRLIVSFNTFTQNLSVMLITCDF